jgi:hypothetical protein
MNLNTHPRSAFGSWMPGKLHVLLICLSLLFFSSPLSSASADLEAKVKAAYIYNFIQFVDWPGSDSDRDSSPIRIGVLGSDPVGTCLEELSGRQVKGRTLKVERVHKDYRKLASFHILFISRSEQTQLSQQLQQVQGSSVLTVSDIDQFSRKGGMIGFFTEGGKIRIEISLAAIKQSNIKLSARLIEVARIVQ